MTRFVVMIEWASRIVVSERQKDEVASKLADGDPCVWLDDRSPKALIVTFDMDAEDYEAALASGRSVLAETMKEVGVPGHPVSVTVAKEDADAQLTWRADSSEE